jgi:hypothetical protein
VNHYNIHSRGFPLAPAFNRKWHNRIYVAQSIQ